jgi:hypothetical protein
MLVSSLLPRGGYMCKMVLILALAAGATSAVALDNFSFQTEQKEKTHQINKTKSTMLRIRYSASDLKSGYANIYYTYADRIEGLLLESYSSKTVVFSGRIEISHALQVVDEIKNLELLPVERGMAHDLQNSLVVVDGKRFNLPEKYDTSAFRIIETFVNDNLVGASDYKEDTVVIAGDRTPAITVSIKVLYENPNQYIGKRVRVLGYYFNDFECQTLSSSNKRNPQYSVWVGGFSTLAPPDKVIVETGNYIELEGSFVRGNQGHGGLWPGELVRITRVFNANAQKFKESKEDGEGKGVRKGVRVPE